VRKSIKFSYFLIGSFSTSPRPCFSHKLKKRGQGHLLNEPILAFYNLLYELFIQYG